MQIGNAITEKMVLDVIIQARDRQLFHAITDCGAGGFSSAVGEMGAELGARSTLITLRSNTKGYLIPRSGSPRPKSEWCWPFHRNGGRH